MKTIKGDLILKKDTTFNESIKVEGNIMGYIFNLKVAGNINARNIVAGDIVAGNITAWEIVAGNINARNIVAGNINAFNIICEKRTKTTKTAKTFARIFIQNMSKLKRKEW